MSKLWWRQREKKLSIIQYFKFIFLCRPQPKFEYRLCSIAIRKHVSVCFKHIRLI